MALLALALTAQALEIGPFKPVAAVTREAYAPLWVRAAVPDGKGGAVAFSRLAKGTSQYSGAADIIATPIDAAGMAHPEQAVTVVTNASALSGLAAAKTPNGYLISMSDTHGNAYVAPLRDDLMATSQPVLYGTYEPYPLVCNGDVCAGLRRPLNAFTGTFLLLDSRGNLIREIAMPGVWSIAAVSEGGFVTVAGTNDRDAVVSFLDREGAVTATQIIPRRFSSALAVAPHRLGAVVFTGDGNKVAATVVRRDSAILSQATLPGADYLLSEISVAAAGDQLAVVFSVLTDQILCTCIPHFAVYGMRLSDTLTVLAPPVPLSPRRASSEQPLVTAVDNGFVAAWRHILDYSSLTGSGSRALRMAHSGEVNAEASSALGLAPAWQLAAGIAAASDRTLALWLSPNRNGMTRLHGARFDRFGTRLDATPIAVADDIGVAAAASDGQDFLVLAQQSEASPADIRLIAVDGGDGVARTVPFAQHGLIIGIAWDGSAYSLALRVEGGVRLMRATPDGTILWTKDIASELTVIAAAGGRTFLAGLNSDYVVHYVVIDAAGNIVATKASAAAEPAYPVFAISNGRDQFLLLIRSNSGPLLAARIGRDGAQLDAPALLLGSSRTLTPFAVPIGSRWIIFNGEDGIDFPSQTHFTIPDGKAIRTAVRSVDGRAALIGGQTTTFEGLSLNIAVLGELVDTGFVPPRRPAVRR